MSSPPTSATRTLRVLLVDDNLDAAEGLAMHLSLEGHNARIAAAAEEAVDLAAAFQPDLVLVDLWLARREQHALLHGLQRVAPTAVLTVLAPHGEGDARAAALRAGASAWLPVPVEIDTLAALLTRAATR